MAKGPRSISNLAQRQSKMIHRVTGAETGHEEEDEQFAEIVSKSLGFRHQNTGCSDYVFQKPQGTRKFPLCVC